MGYLILETRQTGKLLLSSAVDPNSVEEVIINSIDPEVVSEGTFVTIELDTEVVQGEIDLVYDGYTVPQVITSWDAAAGVTTITFAVSPGGLPFTGTIELDITPDGLATISDTLTIEPISGSDVVVIEDPLFEVGSVLYNYDGNEPQDGWQIEYTDSPNTEVNPDGTFTQTVIADFQARVWDPTDNTRGAWATISGTAGISEVNGGDPIVPGEEFTLALRDINSEDIQLLVISAGKVSFTVYPESIVDATSLTFIAPANLPTGEELTYRLYESKTNRLIREALNTDDAQIDISLSTDTWIISGVLTLTKYIDNTILVSARIGMDVAEAGTLTGVIGTIPVGFRPSDTASIIILSSSDLEIDTLVKLNLATNGEVTCYRNVTEAGQEGYYSGSGSFIQYPGVS